LDRNKKAGKGCLNEGVDGGSAGEVSLNTWRKEFLFRGGADVTQLTCIKGKPCRKVRMLGIT
jgi:hypothetical protein